MKNKSYRLLFIGISAALITSVSCAILALGGLEPVDPIVTRLALPPVKLKPIISSTNNAIQHVAEPNFSSLTHTIKSGENLATIFSKLNLSKAELYKVTHAGTLGKQFSTIDSERKLIAVINSNRQLQKLIYHKDAIETLEAILIDDKFRVNIVRKPVDKKIASTQVTINSSLFVDGKLADLSDKLIMQLAGIFAWDIDFALSLRKGDRFTVVYEKLFFSGNTIDTGDIVSAEFINQGRSYTALRFVNKQKDVSYFTPEGNSMQKTFLRTPLHFARISSHFNLKRRHPVLNKIRAHKGVDYAARMKTPIRATGDGVIVYRSRKGGYGRTVIVRHGQKYNTLYAHMSNYKRGQKVGSSVKQGQVIGYVGRSGLATGPHLHYEFRVNGIHRNPLTVKLPHAKPINKSLFAEFKAQTQPFIDQLNRAKANILLVQN